MPTLELQWLPADRQPMPLYIQQLPNTVSGISNATTAGYLLLVNHTPSAIHDTTLTTICHMIALAIFCYEGQAPRSHQSQPISVPCALTGMMLGKELLSGL